MNFNYEFNIVVILFRWTVLKYVLEFSQPFATKIILHFQTCLVNLYPKRVFIWIPHLHLQLQELFWLLTFVLIYKENKQTKKKKTVMLLFLVFFIEVKAVFFLDKYEYIPLEERVVICIKDSVSFNGG